MIDLHKAPAGPSNPSDNDGGGGPLKPSGNDSGKTWDMADLREPSEEEQVNAWRARISDAMNKYKANRMTADQEWDQINDATYWANKYYEKQRKLVDANLWWEQNMHGAGSKDYDPDELNHAERQQQEFYKHNEAWSKFANSIQRGGYRREGITGEYYYDKDLAEYKFDTNYWRDMKNSNKFRHISDIYENQGGPHRMNQNPLYTQIWKETNIPFKTVISPIGNKKTELRAATGLRKPRRRPANSGRYQGRWHKTSTSSAKRRRLY